MQQTPDHVNDRLREAVVRIATGYGLDIFDLQLRREAVGRVLRVTIDRPAPPEETLAAGVPIEEEPIGIDECQRVSQDLSALMDVDEALTEGLGEFVLEVSSPGLDRPLRGEVDYRRFVGRLAKVVTTAPVGRQSHFFGRLAGIDQGEVLIVEGRRTHRVPIGALGRARLEVEF